MRLPDWVAVFPGHFEGPCGKGMCGRPSTTIGFERLFNPLARMEREPFLETLDDGIPARPLNMVAIEATNRGLASAEWAMLTELHEVPEAGVEDVENRPSDALLIDVREPEEFVAGHIPGAQNLAQSEIATRLEELPRDHPILVVCQGGNRSRRAAQFLAQMGYTNVANVGGGTSAWAESGRPVERDESAAPGRRIIETEWAHAGVAVH
jgi:rhodanese-related sulfurtransferase